MLFLRSSQGMLVICNFFSNYLQFHCRRCCPGDGGGVIINMFQFCRTCYDVSELTMNH